VLSIQPKVPIRDRNFLGQVPENPEIVKFPKTKPINQKFWKFQNENQMEQKFPTPCTLAKKCKKIYNTCRAIVPLIKSFVLLCFCCSCGLYKVPAVMGYKKSPIQHISALYVSIFAV